MKLFYYSFIAWVLAACSEQISENYPNLQHSGAQNAMQLGWLPKILPKSAFNIQQSHELDINSCTGKFEFKPHDLTPFLKQLKPINFSQLNFPEKKKENLLAYGFLFYQAQEFDFAIHHEKQLAWFWCHESFK